MDISAEKLRDWFFLTVAMAGFIKSFGQTQLFFISIGATTTIAVIWLLDKIDKYLKSNIDEKISNTIKEAYKPIK